MVISLTVKPSFFILPVYWNIWLIFTKNFNSLWQTKFQSSENNPIYYFDQINCICALLLIIPIKKERTNNNDLGRDVEPDPHSFGSGSRGV